MFASQCTLKRLAPGGTCPPPGDLEVSFAWRLKSSPCDNVKAKLGSLLVLDVRGLQGFGDASKVGLLVFLEL